MFKNTILILVFSFIIFSCSSRKSIIYLQEGKNSNIDINFQVYKLKVDDVLKIDISTDLDSPEISYSFNSNNLSSRAQNIETMMYEGYLIDSNGNINFPVFGKLYVKGKTTDEVRDEIHNRIVNEGLLINPTVDVKILNSHFTILGEVRIPGKYNYLKNNMNILEAIGLAGDLTINGKREDIRLIRSVSNSTKIISIDLTSNDFMSNNFQILSGDIIIVNPNTNRIKNAGIIGNSGTLLSLLSFILSLVIVTSN